MHRQKRSICCLLVRKQSSDDGGNSKTQCGCRAARLFDFTTDSWRSRTVVVLVFLAVYVQSANVILSYSGISPYAIFYLTNSINCLFTPDNPTVYAQSTMAFDTSAVPVADPPDEPIPVEPIDAFVEWVSAFSVAFQVFAFLVGLSSRQHISITLLSYVAFVIFSIVTISQRFTAPIVSVRNIYIVLLRTGGGKCFPALFTTLVQYFFEFIITGAALIAYTIYMISCALKFRDDGNFDDWRLKEVAYPLVRRLTTPVRPEDLPRQKSWFNRILRLSWLRNPTQFDENFDIQQQGLLSREQKRSCCSRQTLTSPFRRATLFCVHTLKDAFSSPPPRIHSLFESPSDVVFSSRIIISLTSCISIMLLIAITVFGVLSSFQEPARRLLSTIPQNAVNATAPELYDFAEDVVRDLPYVSAAACAIGFITIIIISIITLRTYRQWIFELRQGRRPFNPVLVGNGTFWASSYTGHQLSHFLLGFAVCILVVGVIYLAIRAVLSISPLRHALWISTVRVSVPFLINFMIQFILARLYSAYGGKDLRWKFTFQVIDVLNTILSALTTILPSIMRLLLHYSLNLMLAGRLDQPSLFPVLDSAHHTFAAVVYQDHYNNNPIKLVFVDQLLQAIQDDDLLDAQAEKSRRIQRRWRLVALLMKNPDLRALRKHALRARGLEEQDFLGHQREAPLLPGRNYGSTSTNSST